MGIFGYSYPPGCSGPPDIEDGPCAICGNSASDCACPECQHTEDGEKCMTQGCLTHLPDGELVEIIQLLDYRLFTLRDEAKRREKDSPECPKCGKVQKIAIDLDGPLYCCGYELWGNEWSTAPEY